MKIAVYIKKVALRSDGRIEKLLSELSGAGVGLYRIEGMGEVQDDTCMALSFGGDGTFLSCAHRVAEAGVPILGVNLGRLGFLSECRLEDVKDAVLGGRYSVEERRMLEVGCPGMDIPGFWPYALNEAGLYRMNAGMIGVDVSLNGAQLPTYWADGLLVATSSGSTAYNLSAGGPICLPDADVELITPVAPHNLNLRPLVVPAASELLLRAKSRAGRVTLALDNRSYAIPADAVVTIREAPFRLRKVITGKSNFIEALRSRFFWGQDVRNTNE